MLLWIKGCPSPQEIRNKLKNGDAKFQKALVDYLENAHTGDFLTGTIDEVREKVYGDSGNEERSQPDPTLFLPAHPPDICANEHCKGCSKCPEKEKWLEAYKDEVDNLVLRSNVHSCRVSSKAKSCITADGTCAARFPRDLHEKTTIDPEDGHIDMKKKEQFINTFSPPLSMLMRSNTDTTSLLSGTAVKAVISYVTDYVTKQSLKTHQLFSTAYEVLQRQ
ncbi:hypothetical protein GALMADRAFT_16292, partial [Galerina marginata CBS 339.88]